LKSDSNEDQAMSIVELLPASARLSKRALSAWLGGEPELHPPVHDVIRARST